MKTKNVLCDLAIAVVLQLGLFAGSAQTNIYLYSGSETNVTLPSGTYIITAYGAEGGEYENARIGGFGAEMSAEFNFSTPTNLILLVGGVGGVVATVYNYDGSGGGGGSFVVEGSTPLVVAGGGGGGGFLSNGGTTAYGGNGTITTFGSAGGGNAGGSGGVGGNGGTGGDAMLTGFGNIGEGADGGGGFYTDGTSGRSIFGYALPVISPLGGSPLPLGGPPGSGGLSFEDGGAGGLGNLGGGLATGEGGFGGGGGAYSDNNYGFGGGGGGYSGGGGGGASNATTPIGAGGGGGSFIDSSAIAILAEGLAYSPGRGPGNGEIIIIAVPTPLAIANDAAFGFTNGVFGFDVTGPAGSNVVIEASTDLQTWIPLQANLLDSGPLYFSDPQWTNYPERFYRVTSAFTVGGTLTGLPAGDTVTLHNGSDNLTLSTNGTFTFPTALPDGQSYSVTVSGIYFGGLTPTTCTFMNGSGIISGANVTNVAAQCAWTGTRPPPLTGNPDVDMFNAAVADGTANGGEPAVMYTENGGPFRVTAPGEFSYDVALRYYPWSSLAVTVGNTSCSSTTFPSGTPVIQFGTALACGQTFGYGY